MPDYLTAHGCDQCV